MLEIQHVGQQKGNYRIYTNDWTLGADNAVTFSDDLAPDSCRPWVAIERREVNIEPGARYRYRFEITPPPGTAARECRFALMVEGLEPARVQGSFNFPVGGRVGVIVYAAIGGAAPQLEIVATRVGTVNGKPTALLDVRNRAMPTAAWKVSSMAPTPRAASSRCHRPTCRSCLVRPAPWCWHPWSKTARPRREVRFPLVVKGSLEWGKNRLPLDASFAP